MSLSKAYQPAEHEEGIYDLWEKNNAFQADPSRKAERFTISMPPPNATGTLHAGHALGIALQDTMIRHARMQGKDALWLPGTDHAALPVNAIMEKRLVDEGTNKHELGREAFLERIKEFVATSQDTMRTQIRAMGSSCDWSRERYTLDDALNRSVNETFNRMYNDGLIYRGHRIVNWDSQLGTTVSDDEVERLEETAKFYTLQYGPFQISTARPETKFGDKYVVMHPDDKRYTKYQHGDTFEAEWINGPVTATIIKDSAVDPAFGTGVMTITPWHDHTDFDIAERHNLDKEQVIDFDGKLLPIAQEFAGQHITEARPKIVEKLRTKGLVVDVDETYQHNIAVNSRGKGIIEPQIKLQWFVDVNKPVVEWKGKKRSLKQVMRAVIDDQDIQLVPGRFDKTYFHWIDNLRDWCISRQIWWGHRIPVWYRSEDGQKQTYVGVQAPDDGKDWEQDPDTLDTWFSSALWTWSTLLDPALAADYSLSLEDILAKSVDFQTYHPTTVMETGWDILFFWVARMVLATTYMTGQIPFKTVYLHGLLRAEDGQKMSKSKPETMIDPLEVIPEYGTDALRLALIHGTSAGNDKRMSIPKIAAQRNFCNKLWNVARFIEGLTENTPQETSDVTIADYWILSKLQHLTEAVSADLDNYRFSEAYDKLYHFVWDDFADWYIEASKAAPNVAVLKECLNTSLKLLHPFAPFVTETIWQELGWHEELLITSAWPTARKVEQKPAKQFEQLQALVIEVRQLTSAMSLSKPTLLYTDAPVLSENSELVKRLGRAGDIQKTQQSRGLTLMSTPNTWLDIDDQVISAYKDTLVQQLAEQGSVVKNLEQRLANKGYVASAPEKIVQQTKDQLAEAKATKEQLSKEIARFA